MPDFSSVLFWYKILFVTELGIAEGLTTYTLHRRAHFPLRAAASILLMYLTAFLFPIAAYNAAYSVFMFFSLFIVSVAAMKFCYDEPWINVLFCGIIAYTAQHIAFELNTLLTMLLGIDTINVYLPGEVPSLQSGVLAINAVLYVSVFALVYWAVWAFVAVRIRRSQELSFSKFYLFFWVIVTITFDIVFSSIATYSVNEGRGPAMIMLTLSNIFSCVLSLGYQYLMLDKDDAARELRTISMLWKKDKERYELSKENIDLLNIRCHDLKSQIGTLRNINGLIDDNTIIELENALSFYGVTIQTGNPALDVILAEKNILCDKKGIRLTCMIEGERLDFISPGKLYSLFGNALQNAIESAELVEDPEKRLIMVNVRDQGSVIMVHIENSCPENAELNLVNGVPQTTKENKREHGFGIRSMKLLVRQLDGDLDFSIRDGRFNLDIMLPVPRDRERRQPA